MGEYDREEYGDFNEYEEEDEEQEEVGEDEEHEEEDSPQASQELEYLELRQKLKEKIRSKMKKDSSSSLSNSRDKKNNLPYDNFGSFFGPSRPVIAQRVIQESKSLLENPHLIAKVSKTNNNDKNKGFTSPHGSTRPRDDNRPADVLRNIKPKAKLQMIKNTRDYSFLLSDDAELPVPKKDPAQSVPVQKSDTQLDRKTPGSASRKTLNGQDEKKIISSFSQMRVKSVPQKSSIPNLKTVNSRKQVGSSNGSGPGRPRVPNGLPSSSSNGNGPVRPVPKGLPGSSNNGSGPGRPLGPKILPSKTPTSTKDKMSSAFGTKSSVPAMHKPHVSKSPHTVLKQPIQPKKEHGESSRGKMPIKQSVLPSKPQMKQHPPKNSQTKKKLARRYSDDDDDDRSGNAAISIIRNMFGYNPNRYRDDDDDVSDMEANYEDILKEERRSALLGAKEDEEELRKIEEEERRERLRKEAKRRKLNR